MPRAVLRILRSTAPPGAGLLAARPRGISRLKAGLLGLGGGVDHQGGDIVVPTGLQGGGNGVLSSALGVRPGREYCVQSLIIEFVAEPTGRRSKSCCGSR